MGRGPIRNREVFEKFQAWWRISEDIREPPTMSGIARQLKISIPMAYKWDKRLKEIAAEDKEFVASKDNEVNDYIEQCRKKAFSPRATANDLKLYGEVKGFGKKTEEPGKVIVELTADDYFRIRLEAKRRVADFHRERDGDRGVQSGRAVFPEPVCVDTEQEHSADDTVGVVAVSV